MKISQLIKAFICFIVIGDTQILDGGDKQGGINHQFNDPNRI